MGSDDATHGGWEVTHEQNAAAYDLNHIIADVRRALKKTPRLFADVEKSVSGTVSPQVLMANRHPARDMAVIAVARGIYDRGANTDVPAKVGSKYKHYLENPEALMLARASMAR